MNTVKRRANVQALARFPALKHLGPQHLQRLADTGVVEELPAGRLLFKPGLRDQEHLYLIAGEVALADDHQTVACINADSDDGRRELAPERPRLLWGWSKTRVEMLCLDQAALAGVGPRSQATADVAWAPPTDTPSTELLRAQQALAETRQQRDAALNQVQDLCAQVETLTAQVQALSDEIVQIRQPRRNEAAVRPARTSTPSPAAPRPQAPSDLEVPSLRLSPAERGILGPADLEAVLDGWAPEAHVSPTPRR